MQGKWTIDELGSVVALALATDQSNSANGRVRDIPDLRTIRYYTTLGLLDRPAEIRGRTAFYGHRHLLQLVAIKRLQGRGLTLAEIQRQLVGLTNAALIQLTRLPAGTESAPANLPAIAESAPAAPVSQAETSAAFWKTAPAEPARAAELPASPATLQGIPLDQALTLLLAARRPIEPDDIEAIRVVAAPLLKLLQSRRLIGPHQERESS